MMLSSIFQKDVDEFSFNVLKYSRIGVIHNIFKNFFL